MAWYRDDAGAGEHMCTLSNIACQSCRKRKVKCDRELPHCRICRQNSMACVYPAGPRKPGPKMGTSQRSRKKRRRVEEPTLSDHELLRAADQDQPPPNGDVPGAANPSIVSVSPPGSDNRTPEPFVTIQPNTSPTADQITHQESRSQHEFAASTTAESVQDPGSASVGSASVGSLAFIMHPSHDVCTPDEDFGPSSTGETDLAEEPLALSKTCYALGITSGELNRLLEVYFQNMTSFSLFHEPTFAQKLRQIPSFQQLNALIAAMLSFATQLSPPGKAGWQRNADQAGDANKDFRRHFAKLADKFTQEALDECGNDVPSLSLLQALIISTHGELVRGVKGRAWRSLGLCVRMAYEMNLHLIDSAGTGSRKQNRGLTWCQDEERRRAWWAIWEMDVFASTIRRCPTAISWVQNETFLPASDQNWYSNTPQRGCYLESSITKRWLVLEASKNRSAKAWFIVINSLMREAQTISSPTGLFKPSFPRQVFHRHEFPNTINSPTGAMLDAQATLAYALQCFSHALPQELQYRGQQMSFEPRGANNFSSERKEYSGIASIHLMSQLAVLMIYQSYVLESPGIFLPGNDSYEINDLDQVVLAKYFGAADKVVDFINDSCKDTFKYLNPFFASTIWMAAAVLLVRNEFSKSDLNSAVKQDRFELLCAAYKQMVDMWGIATAMQQNLHYISVQLRRFKKECTSGQQPGILSHANPAFADNNSIEISEALCGLEGSNPLPKGGQLNLNQTTTPNAPNLNDQTTNDFPRDDCGQMTGPFSIDVGYGIHNGPPRPEYPSPTTPILNLNAAEHAANGNSVLGTSHTNTQYFMGDMVPSFDLDAQSGICNDYGISEYLNNLLSGPRFGCN